MKVKINNKDTETGASTIGALADELSLPQKGIALAVNNRMIPRMKWASTSLAENDSVVIIKAACGG